MPASDRPSRVSWTAKESGAAVLAALCLVFAPVARADEKAIRAFVQDRIAGATIIGVRRTAVRGLFEVAIRRDSGPAVFYVDAAARVLFTGNLIDIATDRNLTEERLASLSAIDWSSLPLQSAITIRRGKGSREIAVFSDPNCPHCERFERNLMQLDDVTIHIFPYPVIRSESVRQAKAVWCSPDRAKAWNDLMLSRIQPRAAPDCSNPVDEILALGKRLGANATPTFYLRNGNKHAGAMPMADLVPLLDAAKRAR